MGPVLESVLLVVLLVLVGVAGLGFLGRPLWKRAATYFVAWWERDKRAEEQARREEKAREQAEAELRSRLVEDDDDAGQTQEVKR